MVNQSNLFVCNNGARKVSKSNFFFLFYVFVSLSILTSISSARGTRRNFSRIVFLAAIRFTASAIFLSYSDYEFVLYIRALQEKKK